MCAARDGMSASFPDDPAALGYAMVESASRIASSREGRALRPSEVSRHWTKRALDEIRADPGAWVALTAKKSLLFWTRREIPNNHDPVLFATMIPWWGALPGWGLWAPFGIAGFVLMRKDRGAQFLAAIDDGRVRERRPVLRRRALSSPCASSSDRARGGR